MIVLVKESVMPTPRPALAPARRAQLEWEVVQVVWAALEVLLVAEESATLLLGVQEPLLSVLGSAVRALHQMRRKEEVVPVCPQDSGLTSYEEPHVHDVLLPASESLLCVFNDSSSSSSSSKGRIVAVPHYINTHQHQNNNDNSDRDNCYSNNIICSCK